MIPKPTGLIKDTEVKDHLEFIQDKAQGTILSLDAAPTATVPLLAANEAGVYSSVLYWRVADTILVFTPSSTITVT